MNYFSIVLMQTLSFAVYAAVGIVAVKVKVLDQDGLSMLSKLLLKIMMPLMIFTNTINGATREEFFSCIIIIPASLLMFPFLGLLSAFAAKLLGLKGNEHNVFMACSMMGNVGFVGIPILTALFPERGMLYFCVYSIVDVVMQWTAGIGLTAPVDGERVRVPVSTRLRRMFLNPNMISILLSIAWVLTGLRLPVFINSALSKIGAATPPLALLYLGSLFCYTNVGDLLKKPDGYVIVILKMLVFPLIYYRILLFIPGVTSEIAVMLTIVCGVPTMSNAAIFATSQHSAGEYATGIIFITTAACLITLPLICLAL